MSGLTYINSFIAKILASLSPLNPRRSARYLTDAEKRGVKFTSNTSLFLQERRRGGKWAQMTPKNVEDMMKDMAIKSGFVNADMNGKDFNPLGRIIKFTLKP